MNLSEKLQKIRQKPQHVKERILILTMAVFVALILTIWVSTFRFSNFNFKDTGEFVNNTKEYFSNSRGNLFDEKIPEEFMNSIHKATSTEVLPEETNIKSDTGTTTDAGVVESSDGYSQ